MQSYIKQAKIQDFCTNKNVCANSKKMNHVKFISKQSRNNIWINITTDDKDFDPVQIYE